MNQTIETEEQKSKRLYEAMKKEPEKFSEGGGITTTPEEAKKLQEEKEKKEAKK